MSTTARFTLHDNGTIRLQPRAQGLRLRAERGTFLVTQEGDPEDHVLSPAQELWLLEAYFERPPDGDLLRRYGAMKSASLLREAMWSMIQERYSALDFDYVAYTAETLDRFERALAAWRRAA